MCGRINLRATPGELKEFFELFREPVWSKPRFNLGPMQKILVIRQQPNGERTAEPLQWGLVPGWAKDASGGSKMTIARSETVATKSAYRSAFRQRRCLIPASGFFEWQVLTSKSKQAWHVFRKDGDLLAFAGLWEKWKSPEGWELESCSMMTTEPNEFMVKFHDRMPVILDRSDWSRWLEPAETDPKNLAELLQPCPNAWLDRSAVGPFVNSVKNDSPECIRVVNEERTLF